MLQAVMKKVVNMNTEEIRNMVVFDTKRTRIFQISFIKRKNNKTTATTTTTKQTKNKQQTDENMSTQNTFFI
jgi:hypothetical protein